jgi:hypothetical protein
MNMSNKEAKRCRASYVLGALIIPVFLVISGEGETRAYDREETHQKEIPLQGERQLVVMNSRGDIRVIGEKDRKEISCEFTMRARGKNQDDADRLFNLMDVEVKRDGAELTISARYPDTSDREGNIITFLMRRYAGLGIDINLLVPPGLNIRIVTASGDVELASISGAVEITASSGDAEVTGVESDLKISLSSGDMVISDVSGDAFLNSASGDIEAHKIKGDASVRSASGDISLSEIGGDLNGTSASGDITVEGVGVVTFSGTSGSAVFTGVRGGVTATVSTGDVEVEAAPVSSANYDIRTSSGEAELRFAKPMRGGFLLRAQTTSGDISIQLPIKVSKVGRHELSGAVREGKATVVLETASGDIVISEPEE